MPAVNILCVFATLMLLCVRAEYPTCGGCWCVPDGAADCPSDWVPETVYSDEVIAKYSNMRPSFVYQLDCNPYTTLDCTTTPPQIMIDSTTAVCATVYKDDTCNEYNMVTYSSIEEALQNPKAEVSHSGACGLCSTTKDFAVYLTEDFTSAGKICATKGLFNETAGLDCYMGIGLTKECAKIWNYDGIYDGKMCSKTCLPYLNAPNNGPPPACDLNPCLECDEEYAGPIFSSFAARTRRRSGLLSEIIRNCSSISHLNHNPCDFCVC